jgi:hypothetical protein
MIVLFLIVSLAFTPLAGPGAQELDDVTGALHAYLGTRQNVHRQRIALTVCDSATAVLLRRSDVSVLQRQNLVESVQLTAPCSERAFPTPLPGADIVLQLRQVRVDTWTAEISVYVRSSQLSWKERVLLARSVDSPAWWVERIENSGFSRQESRARRGG